MSQLPGYVLSSFSDEEFDPDILEQLDVEYAAIQAVLDAARANLKKIQRDDTRLANGSVHKQALAPETLSLFLASWNPRGAWVTATAYADRDVVTEGGETWLCTDTLELWARNGDTDGGSFAVLAGINTSFAHFRLRWRY